MYHLVTEQIRKILTDHGVWFETFEHESVRTSEEAAAVRHGYSLSQGAKALIVKIRKGNMEEFTMLVVPGDKRFDRKKAKVVLAAKDINFATEEEVSKITGGVQVGGVPPFGNLFGLRVIVDSTLFENEKIIFNAGDRQFSIGMKSEDYSNIVKPSIEIIT